MKIQLDGPAIEAALQKLVDAYPEGIGSEIWIRYNTFERDQFSYTAYQWYPGGGDNVTAKTPGEAVSKLIAEFTPKTPEQIKAEKIAELRAEIDKLEKGVA